VEYPRTQRPDHTHACGKMLIKSDKISVSKLWSKEEAKIEVHIPGPEKQKGVSPSFIILEIIHNFS
jgi:hypothetical protein